MRVKSRIWTSAAIAIATVAAPIVAYSDTPTTTVQAQQTVVQVSLKVIDTTDTNLQKVEKSLPVGSNLVDALLKSGATLSASPVVRGFAGFPATIKLGGAPSPQSADYSPATDHAGQVSQNMSFTVIPAFDAGGQLRIMASFSQDGYQPVDTSALKNAGTLIMDQPTTGQTMLMGILKPKASPGADAERLVFLTAAPVSN